MFWADHKAALKFIFSHLIEAPEDLRGIECVLCKYASRKIRKDMNSNWKWQKKNMQKKKGIYFRLSESLTYNGEIPGRRVVSGLADILFYYQSPSQIHTITRSCVLLNWANWRTRASLKGRAIVTGVWKASRL